MAFHAVSDFDARELAGDWPDDDPQAVDEHYRERRMVEWVEVVRRALREGHDVPKLLVHVALCDSWGETADDFDDFATGYIREFGWSIALRDFSYAVQLEGMGKP